jgi:hypothetical protein
MEAPGVIDLRITRAGWRQVKEHFSGDPAFAARTLAAWSLLARSFGFGQLAI